jgi:hypothetical protein
MTVNASIIICTHNPRPDYLRRVLEALRGQTLRLEQWELIVVDNASERPLAGEWDLSWHPRARHVREDQLGLSFGRERGMREASGDLLVFVDDDNVLSPTYLAEALRIAQELPQLGVWGGSIIPEFEIDPPPHLQRILSFLALREVKSPRWANVATCVDAEPFGAGMCVRATVASACLHHYQQPEIRLSDRAGNDLLAAGDTDICYVACDIGLGMGLFPTLTVTHLIRQERVRESYLLRVMEGILASRQVIAFKWRGIIPGSPFAGLGLLRLAKNAVSRTGLNRRIYWAQIRAARRARGIIAAGDTTSVTPRAGDVVLPRQPAA